MKNTKFIIVIFLCGLHFLSNAQSNTSQECKVVVIDMLDKMLSWMESGQKDETLHLKYKINMEMRSDELKPVSSTADMYMKEGQISMQSNQAEVFIDSVITITHLPNHKIIQLAGTPHHQIRKDRVVRYTAKFDSIVQYATVVNCGEVEEESGKTLLHVEMEVNHKGQRLFRVYKMEAWIDRETNWIVKSKATHTLLSKLKFVEFEYLEYEFEKESINLFLADAREKFFAENWRLKPEFAHYKFMDGRKKASK